MGRSETDFDRHGRARQGTYSPPFVRYAGYLVALVLCGALPATGQASETCLQIEPGAVILTGKAARQQLAVTQRRADGSVHDVTSRCRFSVEPEVVATLRPGGVLMPKADGHAVVRAVYEDSAATVAVTVVRAEWERAPSFGTDIAPLLSKAGCNMGACHGNLNGKGGFRLSLRGDDPSFDFVSLTRDQSGRRLNRLMPAESLILQKPTGAIPHEGGMRFNRDSPEASVLSAWIAAGADFDRTGGARVNRLTVFPAERFLAPGAGEQQLVITASFDDGMTRDVTREASYDVSDPTRASVSIDGLVSGRPGSETTVAVRYMTGRATSRLAFLANRPDFIWRDPPENGPIDSLVFARLKSLRINPSPLASDQVFLRRAFLDAIGRLPDAEEVRAFLCDQGPAKRDRLVDRLLDRPEFADFWALKWADLLRNEEKTMGEKGAWVLERWLRDQIAAGTPLDELARRIVAGLGSTWQNPPSSFHRTNREPTAAAESTSQVFLGIRLQCARCHNHPFDVWTQDDYYGLAACFSNIERKDLNNVRKDRLDTHEINGDEMIYVRGRAGITQPRTGTFLAPKCPHGPVIESSGVEDENALARLASWLTRGNAQFDRNLANRIWFHLFGRGIVDPVDDFRDSNPPSNPALLDALAARFAQTGRRLKPLVAWIIKSRTYQLSATPLATNAEDDSQFSHAAVRLLPAEVLLDGVSDVLSAPEHFPRAPGALRAAQLPGASGASSFLKAFGKPDRLLSCECERSEATTLAQAFQMINGETVRAKLELPANRLGKRLDSGASDRALLDEIYLSALCREPAADERTAVLVHLGRAGNRRKAWEDVVWAVLNSKEFMLRH
jgi:hypothetical protein